MKKGTILFLILLMCLSMSLYGAGKTEEGTKAEQKPSKILWWSHWANEPSKVETIERVIADYTKEHPNVEIEMVWWDKNPLRDAFRSAMTAGSKDVADIITLDTDLVPSQAEAGWLAPLDDLPKDVFVPGAVEQGMYKGHLYKFNIGKSISMVFYNREIMNKLGVTVPGSFQLTADEYLDSVKKASAAGFAGTANAIGNRPYPAELIVRFMMVTMATAEEWREYWIGERSWDSPEMRQLLDYYDKLGKAGFWPESFTTMSIDEFHVYFHTQHKSLYLWIPSWYTGRSFKAEDQGGQSPDFHMGMMLYPKLPGAKYPTAIAGNFESGYGISAAKPENTDTAVDILRFLAQPKYGALWESKTAIPAAVKNTSADLPAGVPPSKWGWYTDEIAKVYGPSPVTMMNRGGISGELADVIKSNINEGIPQGLLTVDKAIDNINKVIGK